MLLWQRRHENQFLPDASSQWLKKLAYLHARRACLLELSVKEGDVVRRGGAIARIDDSQPRFEKQKASAEHDQAVARAGSDVDVRYSSSC